jgi:hypothetical protein
MRRKRNKMAEPIVDLPFNLPLTEAEILKVVQAHPSALQFKNSLRYIQGGTNMTLDRMIERFDVVLAMVFTEGMQKGIAYAQSELNKERTTQKV